MRRGVGCAGTLRVMLDAREQHAVAAARLRQRGTWIDSNPAPPAHVAARWAMVRQAFSGSLTADEWAGLELLWGATAGLVVE